MKTRTVSIRVSDITIARCYLLYEAVVNNPNNIPIGSMLSTMLEGLVVSSYSNCKVAAIDTDTKALEIINQFLPSNKWPDFMGNISQLETELRKATAQVEREASMPKEEPLQVEDIGSIGIESDDIVNDTAAEPDPISAEEIATRRQTLQDAIEDEIDYIKSSEEAQLISAIAAKSIERVSPESIPEPILYTPCPWRSVPTLSEESVESSELYKAALNVSNLHAISVRVTYAKLPLEMWDGDKAVELVKKTYKIFKAWQDLHPGEETA
jgi:hypothetical protein